ncbi:MAG: hypothetical protein ACRETM_00670 [Stenotrophobium sp.]
MSQHAEQTTARARIETHEPASPTGLRRYARSALKRVENVIGVSDDALIAELRQTIESQRQQLQAAEQRLSELTAGTGQKGRMLIAAATQAAKTAHARRQQGLVARLRDFLAHPLDEITEAASTVATQVQALRPTAVAATPRQPLAPPRPAAATSASPPKPATASIRVAKPASASVPVSAPTHTQTQSASVPVKSTTAVRPATAATPATPSSVGHAKAQERAPMSGSAKLVWIVVGGVVVLVLGVIGGVVVPLILR